MLGELGESGFQDIAFLEVGDLAYGHIHNAGLGSQIQNPTWEAQWASKQIFDADGRVNIKFDAISGATRTSIGVERMLKFWLGEFGFGPYLRKLREGEL